MLKLSVIAFKEYALDTLNKCVKLYPWYRLPITTDKVLIHGCDVSKEIGYPMS